MGKVNKRLEQNSHDRSDTTPEIVSLEYFDKLTGEVELYVEIHKADFDQYVIAAENMGMSIEDLVLEAARAEVNDQNTQWVLPSVDADGNIDVKNGTPMVLPEFGKDKA